MAIWKVVCIMISMLILGIHVGTSMLDEDCKHTVTKVFNVLFWVVFISLLFVNILIK